MTKYGRALLTERDREIITGEIDLDGQDTDLQKRRYNTKAKAKGRIGTLERDLEVLAQHQPDLIWELLGVLDDVLDPRAEAWDVDVWDVWDDLDDSEPEPTGPDAAAEDLSVPVVSNADENENASDD